MKIVNFFSEKIPAGRGLLLPGFLLIASLCACGHEEAEKEPAQAPSAVVFYFDCQFVAEPGTSNPYSLYAHIGNYKMKVAELPDCAVVPAADFTRYGIPENAADAAGAPHPNGPQILYAVREDGRILIYRSESAGAGTTLPSYRLLARYADGQFNFEQ